MDLGLGKAAENLTLILRDACGIVIDPLKKLSTAKADRIIEKQEVKHQFEIEALKLFERAKHRQVEAELRRQYNLELIGTKAIQLIGNSEENIYINPDWLNYYIDSCKDIGDETLQDIWARILASNAMEEQEISRVTLDVLKRFSQESCRIFERVAPLIFRFKIRGITYGVIDVPMIYKMNETNNIHVNGDIFHLDHLNVLNSSVIRFNIPGEVESFIHEDSIRQLKLYPLSKNSGFNAFNVSIAGIQILEALNIPLNQSYLDVFIDEYHTEKENATEGGSEQFFIEVFEK